MMRLDKFLAHMGQGTRTEVKQSLKKGNVTVNGKVEKSAKTQIDPHHDVVQIHGHQIDYVETVYLMLNKPKGYISATEDPKQATVIDLIKDYKYLDLFPVGRLDKDTEGLLLITNDGQFSHNLMNPNKHVAKTYLVTSKYPVTKDNQYMFKQGVMLSDGLTKPAELTIIDDYHSKVTIYEGRYHQIKRMFHSIENEVLELKRIQIANLRLDEELDEGQYRVLTQTDIEQLK
ncbi:rRNA pseudouridine synthase [Staphylococcus lugdunensis]|uniref:Pseudouridine synthase n=2 Tax=Staphylococcus TaxID=1279 RepID=A0A292DDZ2_STALU|nr:Ribosomal small subunit pseudouridine synthase A [Staphylococcus lugdunensis HKU09-01]AMG63394.2 rRNA pseudouridine synthase [Staphylococcus lugdunensis]EHS04168.1 pseudouridylate synthase [Staphylococcus lugdunensis VCU139]EKS25326.1 pseudouridine synthase [Staphylococcus lugdunensis ACS-027-V-Sch2]EVI48532.1 pseudouridine synthase, family 1 [Staphylococcus lugdunensis UCIM6116]KAK55565.1 pseudouridylate synthase [Staphylococcus lugdunensis VCU150]KAK55701.1 pseudouridylate synthase [Stap